MNKDVTTEIQEFFSHLLRLGIGAESEITMPDSIDWPAMYALAEQHSLLSVVMDGIDKIPSCNRPQKKDILQWIGITIQQESHCSVQQKAEAEMALLFHSKGIRTYVLKGAVVSECYPKPEHRTSVDMDCFLTSESGDVDVWEKGNFLMEENGFNVIRDFYKNSTFYLPGLTVENHRFLTPWRGNKTLKKLEMLLQSSLRADNGEDRFDGTWLCRPPVMVSALFLIEHAYSHFLHEGLTWRLVLDWVMFTREHRDEIDWRELDARVDEFGFRKFYDAYARLGQFLLGSISEEALSKNEKRMLDDIWAPLDLHESVKGWKGKLALAGNTWRARWKYNCFTDMSWVKALWIQAQGVLFEKEPRLS